MSADRPLPWQVGRSMRGFLMGWLALLLLLGFVLFIVTFVVLAIARLMLMQLSRREGN